MHLRSTALRVALVGVAAAGTAGAAQAFTASNTVPTSQAGSGSGTVSGYTVSSLAYTLDATTPTNLDAVTFTISPTTGTVKVRLTAAGSWYACTNTSGSVSCATTSPQATVSSVDSLTVVAAQ